MATKIEWVRNPDGTKGETWNVVTGCTKVSEGCRNCYAERMAKRLAGRYGYPEQPHQFDVTLHADKMDLPLRWKKSRMVFVCSMSDLFHKDVPTEYIARAWAVMHSSSKHTFQVLTKRPRRMRKFLANCGEWEGWITHDGTPPTSYGGTGIVVGDDDNWPLRNVWLGTSVENQAAADERIPWLLQTPAAVRFVSCEPLLEAVNLSQPYVDYLEGWDVEAVHVCGGDERVCYQRCPEAQQYQTERLDWVICGGESGPGARPMKLDWARSLVQQCKSAGVPVFVKQMGTVWPKNQYLQGKSLYAYGDTKGHEISIGPKICE